MSVGLGRLVWLDQIPEENDESILVEDRKNAGLGS